MNVSFAHVIIDTYFNISPNFLAASTGFSLPSIVFTHAEPFSLRQLISRSQIDLIPFLARQHNT